MNVDESSSDPVAHFVVHQGRGEAERVALELRKTLAVERNALHIEVRSDGPTFNQYSPPIALYPVDFGGANERFDPVPVGGHIYEVRFRTRVVR